MLPPFIPVPWQGAGQTKYHADTGGVAIRGQGVFLTVNRLSYPEKASERPTDRRRLG